MPRPIERGQRYMPGLDGLRALAVLAVLAFHLDIGWAQGGLLGVGIFFTLSGYLITDILLEAWARGRLWLGQFWLARARRLLPALFVMLIAVAAWVTITDPSRLDTLRGELGSAALYVSNWWFIFRDVAYVDLFGPPSPLGHLWSLAIEEQFYLVWPFVLLLGLKLLVEPVRRARIRPKLALATLGLAAISAVLMAILYQPGVDPTRVYDGTDTRAFGLLIGAALAMVWPAQRLRANIAIGARRILDGLGVVALIVIALLIWRTSYESSFLYPTGLVLLSVATAVLVAVLAHPAASLGRLVGWQPLRWIGVRSYGIYLWHFPVIVLTTPLGGAGFDLVRAAAQTLATFAIAAASWRWVEDPIRRGALGRLWRRARSHELHLPRYGWAVAGAALAAVAIAGFGLTGLSPSGPAGGVAAIPAVTADSARTPVFHKPDKPPEHERQQRREPTRRDSTTTSCDSVVHFGDSTSAGLVSKSYLPDRRDRIAAQYARVGAAGSQFEIEGATSIVETPHEGEPNAADKARTLVDSGYRGCWVLALGTNEVANVYVGSSVDLDARIDEIMSVIGDQPVMWLTVRSLRADGPYSEANMMRWNDALVDACARYPNLRIFDWASVARDDWFIDDGIHFTSEGYAARARSIADALADAFPGSRDSRRPGCVLASAT